MAPADTALTALQEAFAVPSARALHLTGTFACD
jgi:hypothetical protein